MRRGVPFEPGNKYGKGRPKGSRNKSSSALHKLLDEHSESLINRGLLLALRGDPKPLLWFLDQLARRPGPTSQLKLPPIKSAADLPIAAEAVMDATRKNACTDAHGLALFNMLSQSAKLLETHDLAVRLHEIEQKLKAKP